MIKFCNNCYKNRTNNGMCNYGYFWCLKPEIQNCPNCGKNLKNIDFPFEDLKLLTSISNDVRLYEEMIKLHNENIIEYELKMSQFRANNLQTQQIQQTEASKPKCPTCGSTNIEKISVGKKIGGSFLFGIFSSDVRNTMHCRDCGAKW